MLIIVPGEYPVTVGLHQARHGEIAPNGQKSPGIGGLGVGKAYLGGKQGDHEYVSRTDSGAGRAGSMSIRAHQGLLVLLRPYGIGLASMTSRMLPGLTTPVTRRRTFT
jgi:hypothetical protein